MSQAEVSMNIYVFLIFNWLELAYLYYIWSKLKVYYSLNNRMNIKFEMVIVVFCWVGMTLSFLLFSLMRNDFDDKEDLSYWDYSPFIVIILRDLCCFYAQTLITVY